MSKLGPTQQWMADHPYDVPCPRGGAGVHWRRARGLDWWDNEKRRRRAEEQERSKNRESEPRQVAEPEVKRKLSLTAQWMKDHPDDAPCPRQPSAAQMWRRKRGLEGNPVKEAREEADRAKYEAAMAETCARREHARPNPSYLIGRGGGAAGLGKAVPRLSVQ
jgi:hypothetical protein